MFSINCPKMLSTIYSKVCYSSYTRFRAFANRYLCVFSAVQQNDHYEPTQKEQDELARALEEVDEQVKSLEQMTGSTDFLDSFLVDDEILVDGPDICADVLTVASVKNDIRGLVHT